MQNFFIFTYYFIIFDVNQRKREEKAKKRERIIFCCLRKSSSVSNDENFVFRELEFLCATNVGDVTGSIARMNFSNQNIIRVLSSADEQRFSVFCETCDESVLRDVSALAYNPIAR